MALPILQVQELTKRYQLGVRQGGYRSLREELTTWFKRAPKSDRESGSFLALDKVSFDVEAGQAYGVIGRNGAGKSTLLKILSRITPPTAGRIRVRGRIASLLEVGTGFHAELTGRENIFLNGSILGMSRREILARFDEIVAFAEVDRFLDTPVKRYSSGMYVRLAFSVAAHLQPEILVVDEVLAVGDSSFQKKCLGKMGQVTHDGRTVIFVSHNLGAIQNLCTTAILLNHGVLRAQGPTAEVADIYLREIFSDAIETKLTDRKDRMGDGRVRVTGVTVMDGAGVPTAGVICGSPCHLDFSFESDRPIRDLAIAWNVRDDMGQPIFRASSFDTGDDSGAFPQSGTLRCSVPRLPLSPGRYSATIEVRVAGVVADYVHGAFVLVVEPGDFYRTGRLSAHSPVLLDHTWALR